jgi:hypothetical protein
MDRNCSVQEIPYAELRKALLSYGQILHIPENWLEIISSNN